MAGGGWKKIILLLAVTTAAAISAGCHRQPAPASAPKAAEIAGPFTRLFNTGAALSRTLTAADLSANEGWTAVAEDVTAHEFAGDAVVVNDKLALVLSASRRRREPLFKGRAGPATARRVGACRRCRGNAARGSQDFREQLCGGRPGVHVHVQGGEGGRGRVPPDHGREPGGGAPGQRGGAAAIEQEIKHVVVPDYFADDVVVSAGSSGRSRVGLPAENCLVNLTGEGDAITRVRLEVRAGRRGRDHGRNGREGLDSRASRSGAWRGRAFGLPFWKDRASGTAGGLRRARPARWNWRGDGLSRRSGDAT